MNRRENKMALNWLLSIVTVFALCSCNRLRVLPIKAPAMAANKLNHLWVTTSDFQSGLLVGIDLLHSEFEPFRLSIHSDAIVRTPENSPYFYVVNRLGADNIQWGNRIERELLGQFSVGRGTNPQDIAVVSPKVAYVSRLESKKLLKIDPSTGDILKEIDLFEKADLKTITSTDPDGVPEMTWMRQEGDHLLILLQRLNTEKYFEPSDKSQLAILNIKNDQVERIITLKGTNPATEIKKAANQFLVGEVGRLGALDGGIEAFDAQLNSLGWITDEKKLGGDIVDCALLDDKRGLAIIVKDVYGEHPISQLVAFSAETGKILSIVKDPGKFSLQQVLVDEQRELFFLSDRDPKKPGIWVFDNKTLQPRFDSYYQTGLPPYHMVLSE